MSGGNCMGKEQRKEKKRDTASEGYTLQKVRIAINSPR